MLRLTHRFFLSVLLGAATTAAFADDTVLVTLKLAKTAQAPADMSALLNFPADCSTCKVIDDPIYARQNAREMILAMRVPRSTPLKLTITTDTTSVRRVILETVDLAFKRKDGALQLTLPAQIADRPDSGELQTHLYWPGVELRFEHADPVRRAGEYTTGTFPTVQREAAANLEFGLLEAIRQLGLDHYVDDENLGRLFLMGFDTNFPHGHADFPPHMHLALWLPNYRGTGSAIPHVYLNSDGLIAHSLVGITRGPLASSIDYKSGDIFTAVDNFGHPIFFLKITPEGWLQFGRFDGPTCNLTPIGHGFDSGIKVACPSFTPLSIRVNDDLQHSEILEFVNDEPVATFHYDADSGLLLQPSMQ